MSNIDTTKLEQNISKILASSKYITSRKQAIDSIVHVAFCYVREFTRFQRPNEVVTQYLKEHTQIHKNDVTLVLTGAMELLKLYHDNDPFSDILHDVYANCLTYEKGQHMTPPDVADFIFELTKDNIKDGLFKDNPLRIGDITGCGLGSLLLSQIRGIYRHYGSDGVKCLDITGVDIDLSMCIATIFQIEVASILFCIPHNQISIYNCNSITEYNDDGKIAYQCIPDFLRHKKFVPEREFQEA